MLDGDPAPLPPKRGQSPQFSAHVYCGQGAGWIKILLGTEVGLSSGNIELDRDPALPSQKGGKAPNFWPMSVVTKRLPISATAEYLFKQKRWLILCLNSSAFQHKQCNTTAASVWCAWRARNRHNTVTDTTLLQPNSNLNIQITSHKIWMFKKIFNIPTKNDTVRNNFCWVSCTILHL